MQSSASPSIPSWYERLTADFDAADARASALVSGLTNAQLNWKPRADAWSIGQCVEHLCLSGEVYTRPMNDALRGRPTGAVDEITPGWFGRWFIRTFIEPTTQKTRARAPRKIAPLASSVDSSILNRFIASNASIRQIMDRAREFDVNRVRFVNPFVGWIRFTLGTGMQIIARHNHRHLQQAERVRQHPAFPASTH